MFGKILIANRGEIVARVARTARRLGYATVAVYSAADRAAPHVTACDEAVAIGGRLAAESYLDIDKIIRACRLSHADAVHPGYGFLSENAEFAERCAAAGLLFIGPPVAAIRRMGDKAEAKRHMLAAGVPCIPGYQGEDQSEVCLHAEAQSIGVPLMIKAAAGGGGRGMRRIADMADWAAGLRSARAEAQAAFGDGRLILERAIEEARHVEIQIFADAHGDVIHLFERDCSIQRRHQKLIEEAPSPAVNPQLRAAMGATACAAARSVGYVGAGTVEFLLGRDSRFFFMEMNTRLQVEHPVTELITGIDLVEWQLRVARGEPLPLKQQQIEMRGHALEVRLYAEDAERDFLPQAGWLLRWRPSPLARCDHALTDGFEVTTFYDPLLAKIVSHGDTREEARQRLIAALRDTVVLGLTSNKAFLLSCLEHRLFAEGGAETDFIAAHCTERIDTPDADELFAAAALLLLAQATARLPQPSLANWHSGALARTVFRLNIGTVTVVPLAAGHYRIEVGQRVIEVTQVALASNALHLVLDGLQRRIAYVTEDDRRWHLEIAGRNCMVEDIGQLPPQSVLREGSGAVMSPMNGRVIAVHVCAGQAVQRGAPVLTLESMKMEHVLRAACDGVVGELTARLGEQVAPGRRLALIVTDPLNAPVQAGDR